MKRFSVLVLALYCCSLISPRYLFAYAVPVSSGGTTGAAADDYYSPRAKLKVISNNNVGKTLVASSAVSSTSALAGMMGGAASMAGLAYYQRTGKDPVYAAASAVASAADHIFVPAYQAFTANFVSPESYPASAAQYVGIESAVGADLADIIDFVKNSADGLYQDFKDLIAQFTAEDTYPTTGQDVVDDPRGTIWTNGQGSSYLITGSTGYWDGTNTLQTPAWQAEWCLNLGPKIPTGLSNNSYFQFGTGKTGQPRLFYFIPSSNSAWAGYAIVHWWIGDYTATESAATYLPTPGAINYEDLKTDLVPWLAANPDKMAEIVQDMPIEDKGVTDNPAPESVPAQYSQLITQTEVNNFYATNTANVYNQYLNTVTNNTNSTTNEIAQAAAEAAKAQEEAANQEDEPETFSAISDSAFGEAYNPGEYDIPARFTSFLNNVKSSGLFSFSSSFFNSLPGGGTPTYTIEAGRYGTHAIDLSQTLSVGLAVLKSILLACFGFLSIRAVIMKR